MPSAATQKEMDCEASVLSVCFMGFGGVQSGDQMDFS